MKIKHGCTRTVFLIGNYAIKIPSTYSWIHFLQGLIHNLNELKYWKWSLSGNFIDSRFLCPIIFYIPGGWLLVMKRCQSVSEKSNLDTLYKELSSWGISDLKPNNCGLLNNSAVCLDYAS